MPTPPVLDVFVFFVFSWYQEPHSGGNRKSAIDGELRHFLFGLHIPGVWGVKTFVIQSHHIAFKLFLPKRAPD
jgi:hypothetical protein